MANDPQVKTVNLATHTVRSGAFDRLYAEGMDLVDEASNYLDHEGRAAARTMEAEVATLYASESMRLTTRLMQLASWLLLQRAANTGEMTAEQVTEEKSKVRLQGFAANFGEPEWPNLPQAFRTLIERSLVLQRRVAYLEREVDADVEATSEVPDPVGDRVRDLAKRLKV